LAGCTEEFETKEELWAHLVKKHKFDKRFVKMVHLAPFRRDEK